MKLNFEEGGKASFIDAHKHQTAGRPPTKESSTAEWRIIDLMKGRPNLCGNAEDFESLMPSTADKKSLFGFKNHATGYIKNLMNI